MSTPLNQAEIEAAALTANLIREMAYAAAKFVSTDDGYWREQMDYLEGQLRSELAGEQPPPIYAEDVAREINSRRKPSARPLLQADERQAVTSDKGVVERLRAEIEFQQGDAAVWGVDTYGDLPRNLAVMSEAADLIASLQGQVEALTDELDEVRQYGKSAEARVQQLEQALKPFARIADMTDSKADGASVTVNVNRCRDARAALSPEVPNGK